MKRRLPPLNALRAFEAAARHGRMTAAADELSVTPGAISRQVRQLEEALGVALFEGSKSRPQLSAAGKTLLPALSAAFDRIEAAAREVSDSDTGVLDIACFSTFTVKWLIPRLYDFRARYPEIEIRLNTGDGVADIKRERCDLLIAVDGGSHADDLTVQPLFAERLGPVMAPSLAAASQTENPASLAAMPVLHTKARMDAWSMWSDAAGMALAAPPGPVFEHYYFTLEAAVAGLGVCIAPWHLVIDDIRAGRLIAPFGFQESAYRYVAIRRQQTNRKLDRFCAWLQTQADSTPLPPHIRTARP